MDFSLANAVPGALPVPATPNAVQAHGSGICHKAANRVAIRRMQSFFKGFRSSYVRLAVAVGLVLTGLLILFDWNWLRGPLVGYLVEKSGREIRLEDLDVDLDWALEPTVRLRGVYIQNAPWAGDRPFATAAEASFKVSLRSVWEGRPVISRLVLIDADVDMQREADGRRNWRLKHPDDRSPGRVTVHTLEAHRTTIRFANRAIDLRFVGVATPLEKPTHDGLSTRIRFEGTFEGAPYSGMALSAGVLSFRASGVVFPMRGYMNSRSTRVELDGLFSDIFDIGMFDARMELSGATLSELHPFLHIRPPPSRPYRLEAQLTQTNDVYEFKQLKGKIGTTDLAGEATYDRSGDRRRVHAALRSDSADVADLRALLGMRPGAESLVTARPARTSKGAAPAHSDDRVLPTKPLRVDRLRSFDATLKLEAKKLHAAAMPMLESLRVAAELAGGVLELKPLTLGVAGGHIAGTLRLDARERPVSAHARIELRDLKLERLLPSLAARARTAGVLRGEIELAGRGDSVAAMLGNAKGSVATRLDGGHISNLADAKLGLNFGKVLGLMLRGDRDIAINCGALAFDLSSGMGKSRIVVLDTAQTHTQGVGTLNLREERWALVLNPQPKKPGLLTRRASVRVNGSFRDAKVSIEERIALGRGVRADAANDDASPMDCAISR
jgi:AsmA family protein